MSQTSNSPHSPEAEASVLGSVLIDGDAAHFMTLRSDDFFIHR